MWTIHHARNVQEVQKKPDVAWSKIGRPAILDNSNLLLKIGGFENYEARAVGKDDLKNILKAEK